MLIGVKEVDVARNGIGERDGARDALAVEEPLEIRLQWQEDGAPRLTTIAVTMRTPGSDEELAAGFLFSEGMIRDAADIVDVRSCRTGSVRVELSPGTTIDLARLERHSYTTSSCGLCGKTSLAALRVSSRFPLAAHIPRVDAAIVRSLPASLRRAQTAFDATGGLHASALFDADGRLVTLREDVGRHNALDKVIGAELFAGRLPGSEQILMVSGRVSFELVQKALIAGIPIIAAIGAPSSLAVELANEVGMTLLGFVRADRFNIYSSAERIAGSGPVRALARADTDTCGQERAFLSV